LNPRPRTIFIGSKSAATTKPLPRCAWLSSGCGRAVLCRCQESFF